MFLLESTQFWASLFAAAVGLSLWRPLVGFCLVYPFLFFCGLRVDFLPFMHTPFGWLAITVTGLALLRAKGTGMGWTTPILIPWLLIHYGWRPTFMLVGFSGLVWLIPWLLVFPARLKGGDAGPQPPSAGRHRTGPITFNRNLLGICLGFFCFDYYWYLLVGWLPDYLVTVRHLTILRAGIYTAMPFLVFGVSEPIGGWIADRLIRAGWDETRTRKGIVTIAFLTGLLLIPASRVESANAAIALVIGASLVGLATGNLLVILQSCAPPEEVGVWTGFENFAGNIGGIVAPLLTGLLISRTGSYAPAFALAAGVLVTGLLAYWFVVGKLGPASRRAE